MLYQHIDDPYYGIDRSPSHKGVSVPRFDVREGPDAFYLDGELPGLIFEYLENETLIVRGTIRPKLLAGEKEPLATAAAKGVFPSQLRLQVNLTMNQIPQLLQPDLYLLGS